MICNIISFDGMDVILAILSLISVGAPDMEPSNRITTSAREMPNLNMGAFTVLKYESSSDS